MKQLTLLVIFCVFQTAAAVPLGTAFTYQGLLNDGGVPADGNYVMTFEPYDSAVNGQSLAPPVSQVVAVTDGAFTVELDFGDGPFVGEAVWLEVAVRSLEETQFTLLDPRQQLTAVPYALHAQFVGADAVTGMEIADGSIAGPDIDPSEVQARVSGGCPPGEAIVSVNEDGSVSCGGDDDWIWLEDGRIQSSAGVRIQPDPQSQFPMTVRHDSGPDSPHLALTESVAGDSARISFYNDADFSRAWTLGGEIADTPDGDRFVLASTEPQSGNSSSLITALGNRRVGVNTDAPLAPFSVGAGTSSGALGDVYIGDGVHGLLFGVALGGGGAGTGRIRTQTMDSVVLGNSEGDVMAVGYEGDRVGIGTLAPQQKLHVSNGLARLDSLAHAGPENRQVFAEPDGDLVLETTPPLKYLTIPFSAFRPQNGAEDYQIWDFSSISGTGLFLFAPVNLPDGAAVESLDFWFYDEEADAVMGVVFIQNPHGQAAPEDIVEASSQGEDPGPRSLTVDLPEPLVIDNATSSYVVVVGCGAVQTGPLPPPSPVGWSGTQSTSIQSVVIAYR